MKGRSLCPYVSMDVAEQMGKHFSECTFLFVHSHDVPATHQPEEQPEIEHVAKCYYSMQSVSQEKNTVILPPYRPAFQEAQRQAQAGTSQSRSGDAKRGHTKGNSEVDTSPPSPICEVKMTSF